MLAPEIRALRAFTVGLHSVELGDAWISDSFVA